MDYDLELLYSICFSELVHYPDENDDSFIERLEFRAIRDFLEIEIDVIDWINQCHKILQGERHLQSINLYYSKNGENYILLESYFDPTDQLDFVNVGVKTIHNNNESLKALGRAFSDVCRYIVAYEEGSSSIRRFYPIDEKGLQHRVDEPKKDLSKGKLVRKIYTGDSSLNVEFQSYYWRNVSKEQTKTKPMNKLFGLFFILTGIFAIVGGLYTWGDGAIFSQTELLTVLIPWADIILTGPLSLVCGYGILKKMKWGSILGLMTSGIYVFGSVLVFITMVWNQDYSVFLILPSFSGFSIGTSFVGFTLTEKII